MNPFIRPQPVAYLCLFAGFASGFLAALIFPRIGWAGFAFQLGQAQNLRSLPSGGLGFLVLVFQIFVRNYAIALLIAAIPLVLLRYTLHYRKRRPYRSGDFGIKLKKEISFVLTIYPLSVIFSYGFIVLGLFLAFVFLRGSFTRLLIWVLYLIPHGFLEIFGLISSASASLVVRDACLGSHGSVLSSLWSRIPRRSYASYLAFLLLIFLFSAILEVYVSQKFMDFARGVF